MLSLLKTKLNAPQLRDEWVSRPLLLDRLNQGLSGKLILVSAPAGFGKTSLLGEWTRQCHLPVAWLSLDENDNDPSRFWSYFVGAVQTIKPGIGEAALASFQSGQPQSIEAFLITLINEITDNLTPFVIVLDDYHLINAQAIQTAITFLLEHMPAQMHLIISGRSDPPIPLARFRASNQVTEMRSKDLRFNRDETATLANDVLKLGISENDLETLIRRTEGWIASLQMAITSMRGREDISGFINKLSGSHRFVLEYLVDEVLAGQEEDIRRFLYQTSILRRMTGPLCDAVTGRNDGREMLLRLEKNNMFLQPLDDEDRWYRYHQLFADVLSIQLDNLHLENKDILHSRASLWFEKEGLLDESIYHALQARDLERAASLIERTASSLVEHSQILTLLNLVSNLPQDIINLKPWLSICYAWALLLSGQPGKVEPVLQAAEGRLENIGQAFINTTDELSVKVRGHALTIRAYIARAMGDIEKSIELSSKAAEMLPDSEATAQSANVLNLAISEYMNGDVLNSSRYFEEAREMGTRSNFYVALEATCSLGDLEFEEGRLIKAAETYQHALTLATEYGGGHLIPAASHAYHGLGRLCYERNDLKEARRYADQGIELSEEAHLPNAYRYANLALISQALGDEIEAEKAIKKAEATVTAATLDALHISAWKTRLLLARGDLPALREWTTSQELLMNQSKPPPFVIEMPYLTSCLASIVLGKAEQAKQFLIPLFQKAENQGRIMSMIEIMAIQALAFRSTGSSDEAGEALERALILADGKGFIRTFVDFGAPMQQLLRQALQISKVKDYVQQLLSAFPRLNRTSVVQLNTDLVEYLNEREKQILRFMADGLSNKTIADNLYLSINTVKWYTRQIYNKLGVNSRVEAVNRARNLDIL
jgi:LuxR family maltose regulon positive regulatory protein